MSVFIDILKDNYGKTITFMRLHHIVYQIVMYIFGNNYDI